MEIRRKIKAGGLKSGHPFPKEEEMSHMAGLLYERSSAPELTKVISQ